MNNEKLQSIGNKLDISERDLENIRRQNRRYKFLYPMIGGIIAICSTIAGYLMGKNADAKLVSSETGAVYPYTLLSFAVGAPLTANLNSISRTKRLFILLTIIITVIVSIVGFTTAYDMARPVEYYSGAIRYGVYNKR